MKFAYKLVALSVFATFVGCAVQGDESSEDVVASSLAAEETSVAKPAEAEDAVATEAVTCFQVWTCRKCINFSLKRNVLTEQCSDGTSTVIFQGPCGEPCL